MQCITKHKDTGEWQNWNVSKWKQCERSTGKVVNLVSDVGQLYEKKKKNVSDIKDIALIYSIILKYFNYYYITHDNTFNFSSSLEIIINY